MRMASCGLVKTILGFRDKARNLHLNDSEVDSIEEKGHTSYCDNYLKDGVACSKLAVFAIFTDRTVEIVTKKLSWTDLIPWWRTAHYHLN